MDLLEINNLTYITGSKDRIFGRDALTSYSGEKFEITWGDSLNLFRYYTKDYGKKKMKVRKEIQEYPNKPLEELFRDKLEDDDDTTLFPLKLDTIVKVFY